MNEREIDKENLKIWHNEINLFHDLLCGLTDIKLTQIDIRRANRNNHYHPEINKSKTYLYLYSGSLHLGKAHTQYHGGWQFDVGSYMIGLGSLDALFETNLKKYPKEIIKRIPKPQCTGCDERCDGGEDWNCYNRLEL